MIIEDTQEFSAPDGDRFAWSGLRRFQNVAHTIKAISSAQYVPPGHERNLKKQAEQIRNCVGLAIEYATAAKAVTMHTKPLLLYYSTMHLALAEILLKQDGRSSLDKARAQHSHHGLVLKGAENVPIDEPLEVSASILGARPLTRGSDGRFGTFELWHRSSRETPLSGSHSEQHLSHSQDSDCAVLLIPDDNRLPQLSEAGISLLEVYRALPSMAGFLTLEGISPSLVRMRARSTHNVQSDFREVLYVIQPDNPDAIDRCIHKITFSSSAQASLTITELPVGYIIDIKGRIGTNGSYRFPLGTQINSKDIWLFSDNESLNEFGLYYVGLYILGNYVRYFPDKWMSDLERSSPLALSATEFVSAAEERVPILSLSELSRKYCLIV